MSRAFMKESDDQWLSDISPTVNALIYFLTRENNGVRVHLRKEVVDDQGKTHYEMSNGLSYVLGEAGKWTAE